MSVYLVRGKGWRYDFTLNGQRHTKGFYRTKRKALDAASEKRKEIAEPPEKVETPTDMGFLELVNRRLDHVEAFNSRKYYEDYCYMARRWTKRWGHFGCQQLSVDDVERFLNSACQRINLCRQQRPSLPACHVQLRTQKTVDTKRPDLGIAFSTNREEIEGISDSRDGGHSHLGC